MQGHSKIGPVNEQSKDVQTRLEAILRLSPVGIGVTRSRDGSLIEFNDALLEVLGCTREDIAGRTSAELGIWADPAERTQAFGRLAAGESIHDMPIIIRRRDGKLRNALFRATPVELDGEAYFIGSLRDVTDELAEKRVREIAERRLQVSLAAVPVTVFHQDTDLRYTFIANPQIGMPVEAIVDHFDEDLFDPADAAVLRTIKQRVLASGQGERHEIPIQREGREFWFDTLVEPERDDAGYIVGIVCAGADVTERRQREDRYRAVLEDQTELIARYRPDGTMVYVNEVYARFFGKCPEALVGSSWHPVAHPDDVPMIEARIAAISTTNPVVTIENRVFAGDGSEHWMEFVNRGLFDGQGRLCEIQSVGRDITRRKQAEVALAESRAELLALFAETERRLEEQRKEIAREVHDQLGAALTAIGFRVDLLVEQVGQGSALADDVERIKSLVSEARTAAREICNSLRPPALDDLGLVATCRWYVKDWSRLIGIRTRLRCQCKAAEPSGVLAIDLFRCLQELLNNIAKHAEATEVRFTLDIGPRRICLKVGDNGRGMPLLPAQKGFGLPGVRERMARHGGRVEVNSSSGGVTVSLCVDKAGPA